MMKKQFIRFKDIPEDEISLIYDGDCGAVGKEIGVSCYEFIKRYDNYNIVVSSVCLGFIYNLGSFINDLQDGDIPCYLIEADQVGIGNYGEPVVRNIEIIGELSIKELAESKPEFKMDRTDVQLVLKNVAKTPDEDGIEWRDFDDVNWSSIPGHLISYSWYNGLSNTPGYCAVVWSEPSDGKPAYIQYAAHLPESLQQLVTKIVKNRD